jgi:hypothetical protein
MGLFKIIFKKFPLALRVYIREQIAFKEPLKMLLLNIEFKKIYREYNEQSDVLSVKDGIKTWFNSFKKFLKAQPNEKEVAFEFFRNSIKILKESEINKSKMGVILICVVKNDLLKIKKLVEHHRVLGVQHFAILDNGSRDGTLEWLEKQHDVDLFYVEDKYTTNRREAWINKIIAFYGLNRWYLILDSDELLAYYHMETKNINSLIEYCNINSLKRMRAIMIDMYASDSFYSSNNNWDYIENCKYFDLDSYKYEERDLLDLITGGPRGRLFKQNPWLTKYPLCYFEEGDIQGKSHFLFPYNKNKNTSCSLVLLHYKFLPSDIQKYREISKDGNYFNGSIQYKEYVSYIDSSDKFSFMDEQTTEYIDSESLYKIPVLKKIKI